MAQTVKVNKPKSDIVNKSEGIILYDKDNKYPNTMLNIIDRSPTAQAVRAVRTRFLYGRGMTESGDFWKRVVNARGHRVDQIARRIVDSYVTHKGFALHFNYNALYEKTSVRVIPFEHCRLGKPDDNDFKGKVIVYDKWNEFNRRKAKAYNTYNPDPQVIARQVELAGGWNNYQGQIWYFGENGEMTYPLSPFEACRNEMVTELAVALGKNSNASTNFLASQIFVYPGSFSEHSPYPEDKERAENGQITKFEQDILDMLGSMQGASKMGAVGLIENKITDNDGKPVEFQVLKFDVQSFDRIHEHTEQSCENVIIKVSGVPHILIVPTATGFSQELLENYYQFYNEATSYDRQIIEETFQEIFRGWESNINPSGNYSIKPLTLSISQKTNI